MKPYFAVLYDSFLESVRSKVLWILLAAWTLLLCALFPLSLSEGESYGFNNTHIRNPKAILDQLAAASEGKGTRKHKAVYAKLDEDFQGVLKQRQNNQRKISIGKLIESLNKVLQIPDLYDKQVWTTADKRPELKELIAKENRTSVETEKLNRGLIDLAFEGSIKAASGQASWITYGGIKLGSSLPLPESQIRPIIETGIFPLVMRLGLGIVAMFVAIIITSPMIPDMFQTGSMHLLLSKPISRSLLFLTKFVGGCSFVAVNIVFLLIGLYVYAGVRLHIWNAGILWCIPLFIFMFMIFYSVSALVGLVWKNPIICVVLTAAFWGVCFGVGLIHFYFDVFLNINNQTQRIYCVGDTPMINTQQGRLQFWDDQKNAWKTAFGDVDGQRIVGPVWLESEKSIYFGRVRQLPFGFSGGEDIVLEIVHAPDLVNQQDETFKTKIWDDGRLDSGPNLPPEPKKLFPWRNSFAVLNDTGVYRFDPEVAAQAEIQKGWLGGFNIGLPAKATQAYPNITPKDWDLTRPMDVAVDRKFEQILVYSRGRIVHYAGQGEVLEEVQRLPLDIPPETVAILGTNASTCIVCAVGMAPMVIDIQAMKIRSRLQVLENIAVKQIQNDETGRFYLLATDGSLWTIDANGENCSKPTVAGQGSALAIHVTDDKMWVAHSGKQADLVQLGDCKSLKSIRPKASIPELIYKYAINPFYQVNPKPAAVNETIEFVLKNPKNKTIAIDRNDLEAPKIASDPWTPIWSNLAFIGVMLSISCWYLYRQDL